MHIGLPKNLRELSMIRFNKPFITGSEIQYLQEAIAEGRLSGDGRFTKLCTSLLSDKLGGRDVLLTHSCTAALEMAAILADIQPGDEVIMPSYTFVSTANAFVLRGAVPVFVDIRPDTLNIDEKLIRAAITKKTKAIVVVHYAGVPCEMDEIEKIANEFNLILIEDAAQAFGSEYKGRKLGTIGDFAAFSFHETKNIIAGEGGALVVNNTKYFQRAEIIREKGTNRSLFFRGEVDKYTWVDLGSSYLPGELISAFLYAQVQNSEEINDRRMRIWQIYFKRLSNLQSNGRLKLPFVPVDCAHNAHLFYLIFNSDIDREHLLNIFRKEGIGAVFHYVPLHNSIAGKKYGRMGSQMTITEEVSECLLRLPLYPDLTDAEINAVCDVVEFYFSKNSEG